MLNTGKQWPLEAVTLCDGPLNPSHATATQRPYWSYSLVIAFKLTEYSSDYDGKVSILEEGVEFS